MRPALAAAIVGAIVAALMPAVSPAASTPAPAAQTSGAGELQKRYDDEVKPLFKQFCYSCHGEGKHKGKFAIDKFTTLAELQADGANWHKALENMRDRAMPPEDKPQPTQQQFETMMAWVDDVLAHGQAGAAPDPGRVTIRRLNRTEYNNTIRDLAGVNIKPAMRFPLDDSGYGFDNIADVLSMSPLLAEKYIAAAEEVLDRAIVELKAIEAENIRYSGAVMHAKGEPAAPKSNKVTTNTLPADKVVGVQHSFKHGGEYDIKVRAQVVDSGGRPAQMRVKLQYNEVASFEVTGKQSTFTKRVKVERGDRPVTVQMSKDSKAPANRRMIIHSMEIDGPYNPAARREPESHQKIFVARPGPSLSDRDAAKQVIEHFATRAFRRPVKPAEVERLLKLYDTAKLDPATSFEQAVKLPLTAVLVSPHFLFRVESDEGGDAHGVRTLGDYELASRLSYFLWSSMPDDELFSLAAEGRLQHEGVLAAQVKRMLADPKAGALTENFAGQWLELRSLEDVAPDTERFPTFDDSMRLSMRMEIEAVFDYIVKEDRSIIELIASDYTFVNERLARHYGISGVRGPEMRKVDLSGTPRGGVITSAAILTLTSNPTRTSPVKRGAWVLEQVLGTPPPPAPPDVPQFPEGKEAEATGTVRQRLTKHQENPNCTICHRRMDPIGFALENFDAVGRWRDKDGTFPIDASGVLPDGSSFTGADGLKKLLVSRKDQVARAIAERMMTYALGRGVEYYDRAAIETLGRNLARDDYRFSSLVTEIVKSDPFRKRRVK